MASSDEYGWRLPDSTDQPVVHVDMANLAADIESTVLQTPKLMPGFPKPMMADSSVVVSGWKGYAVQILKYKLADNLYRFELDGPLLRDTNLTIAAGAGGITVSNILPADCVIEGIPGGGSTYRVMPLTLNGQFSQNVQAIFRNRALTVRAVANTTITAGTAISVSGWIGYGTT